MSSLQALTQAGSVSLLRAVVSSNPNKINDLDEDSRTALHWACSTSNLEIVELLTGYDECDVNVKDAAGWTALMIAASVGNEDILQKLIEKGANVNETSSSGQSALHFSVSKGHIGVTQALIAAGANVNQRDGQRQNALHRASSIGAIPLLSILINSKSPLNASDSSGWTALHHACSEGHGEAVLFLLGKGADMDRLDKDGKTAIEVCEDSRVRAYLRRMIDENT